MPTKGDLLKFALAFALRAVRLHRFRLGLSEEDRYRVAHDAVAELRKHGGWRELDEEARAIPPAVAISVREAEKKDAGPP